MAPLNMVAVSWWKLLVLLSLLGVGCWANDCSFVRSYRNEQCVYNIHLTQGSSDCADSYRGRRHFRRHLGPQNDYEDKLDSMQKDFFFMKDSHEKRLKDLEGTVRDLMGGESSLASLMETTVRLTKGAPEESQGRTLNDDMLNKLHEEFAKLRQVVRQKTEQLFDLQLKFNETQKMLEKSQVDIFSLNQDVLDSENKVAILERERAVLKNQLKDRDYKMSITADRLASCETTMEGQEEQLLTLIRSENTLSEAKMTCELILNKTKEEMKKVERRYRHMKSRHGRVKNSLAYREKELIDCYAAKTQTFCGFEDPNRCGFTQPNDTSDFFDWEWGEGGTPSKNTGPTGDHTCGSQHGHFMYIEASAKGRGKNAIIFSPMYRGLNPQCLQFYYHMHGRDTGTLNVYAKARGGEELASVWRAWGNQGDLWSVARLAIPKELARAGYQIVFEGITENGYQGDIAIDDISVNEGGCGEGVAPVVVQFNSTQLIKDGKQFARNIKRLKLSKVPAKHRKREKKNDN